MEEVKGLKVLQNGERLRLDELVSRMVNEYSMTREEAARAICRLKESNQIELIDNSPPKNLFDYFRSAYASWFWALLVVSAITLLSIFVIPQQPPFIYVRYIAGASYVLYLPGYSLIEALYSKAGELDDLERLALSIGLSLAVVPLIGLVLNYTPWGIRLIPIILSLMIFTIAMAIIAAKRKLGYIKLAYSAT
ncbi:MAG: DUF1616 domain-containing protein [Conexivisphaerales archaeon]